MLVTLNASKPPSQTGGGFVFVDDKGSTVIKTQNKLPRKASAAQLRQRALFKAASVAWSLQDSESKSALSSDAIDYPVWYRWVGYRTPQPYCYWLAGSIRGGLMNLSLSYTYRRRPNDSGDRPYINWISQDPDGINFKFGPVNRDSAPTNIVIVDMWRINYGPGAGNRVNIRTLPAPYSYAVIAHPPTGLAAFLVQVHAYWPRYSFDLSWISLAVKTT